MFEFLDKPREAVWNLGRGVSDMLEGNAPSAADIIPGLAGIAGTAGLAATGVGLPLALLAGSALGGGAQAAVGNKAMTPGEFLQEHAGMEQGSPESTVSSMLLGMATDPLTFAGAGIGRGAGKALGGNLDRTAEVLGPRYGTTTEDLTKMITPYVADMKAKLVANGGVPSRSWAEELLHPFREAINSPNASRLLSEVHPESTVLGSGLEGFALRSPAGNVTRIGEPDHFIEGVARGRPVSDMMLQPTRSVSLRDELSGHRVEHVPFAEGVGTVDSPARDELARACPRKGSSSPTRTPAMSGCMAAPPR